MPHLVLSATPGERIIIGHGPDEVVLEVVKFNSSDSVRLSFVADESVPVDREEVRRSKLANGELPVPVPAVRDWFADVLAFHRAFDAHIEPLPRDPGDDLATLRDQLITEECEELFDALERGDLPELADACIDLIYVVLGTMVSFGMDPHPLWEAVHRANMAKLGGPVREDGKRLKPEGWQPPDIKGLLAKQGPIVGSGSDAS